MCRVKNKFGVPEESLVGGYRDLMLSVIFTGADGLRCPNAPHPTRACRGQARKDGLPRNGSHGLLLNGQLTGADGLRSPLPP